MTSAHSKSFKHYFVSKGNVVIPWKRISLKHLWYQSRLAALIVLEKAIFSVGLSAHQGLWNKQRLCFCNTSLTWGTNAWVFCSVPFSHSLVSKPELPNDLALLRTVTTNGPTTVSCSQPSRLTSSMLMHIQITWGEKTPYLSSMTPHFLFSRLCEKNPKSLDSLFQGIYVHYRTTELHQW